MNALTDRMKKWNIDLSDVQISQFERYYELLIDWNNKINLTAITEFEDVLIKHFLDSSALINYLDMDNINLLDVGTGAGFPGLVLKIVNPKINVVLVDSLNKRVNFLNLIISELSLSGISAIHSRIEDLAHDDNHREKYDVVTSRAVANMSTLSEYCIPFVKIGGIFAPYKSGNISDEVNSSKNAINILGGKINSVEEYILPDTDYSRSIVFIDKVKQTDSKYPRKAGVPSKSPL